MLQKAPTSMPVSGMSIHARGRSEHIFRSLCQWAVLDPGDKILDLNCENGRLLYEIGQKTDCELCGITSDLEKSRQARVLLPDADILYASAADIPWRSGTFDLVMSPMSPEFAEEPREVLAEALRVLKPGGQFMLALPWLPSPLRQIAGRFSADAGDLTLPQNKHYYTDLLEEAGFTDISWRLANLSSALIIGFKKINLPG